MTATDAPRIVVLAGGVGGSKFVVGVREAARRQWPDAADGTRAEITVIANTGDDLWLSGLRLQPDVDSMIYALAGVNDTDRGWGRTGESERVAAELHAWGAGWPWFTLGDLDLGAHIARTGWLRDGASVTEVVARLASRWPLGVRLLPMTDAEVDTHVMTERGRMHFQEWWTRHRATLPAQSFDWPGIERSTPAPGVLEAIAAADVILFAPSNPVVSIGPILTVPGIADALRAASGTVVGVSPIIAGAPVRGMADACLAAVGIPATADAVGRHYGARAARSLFDARGTTSELAADGTTSELAARGTTSEIAADGTTSEIAADTPRHPSGPRGVEPDLRSCAREGGVEPDLRSCAREVGAGGLLDAWLIGEEDAALAVVLEGEGLCAPVRPLWMRDLDTSARLAADALEVGLPAGPGHKDRVRHAASIGQRS